MPLGFTILIADRNRHVRNFLRRELAAEGYQIEVAADGREVLRRVGVANPPDLLILDLEMPYSGGLAVLERLQRKNSQLPVIIHAFPIEDVTHPAVQHAAAFVEKTGNTDRLKAAVLKVFREYYPDRFTTKKREEGGVR